VREGFRYVKASTKHQKELMASLHLHGKGEQEEEGNTWKQMEEKRKGIGKSNDGPCVARVRKGKVSGRRSSFGKPKWRPHFGRRVGQCGLSIEEDEDEEEKKKKWMRKRRRE